MCGAVGQSYCIVISERDVIDTGRKGRGEGICFAAKTFRARGWIWTCALSGHTCRFLQFVAAIAVTTSSGTQVNKIWEHHPAIETSKRLFLDGIEAPCDLVDCSLIVRVERNQQRFELEFFRVLLLTL